MAKLYYLENKVKTYNDQAKYFVNGSDAGGKYYVGASQLLDARFFLDKATAKRTIPQANDWWQPYDFQVKSIEISELKMLMEKSPKNSFVLV